MVIYKNIIDLQTGLSALGTPNKEVGFVPTMGALHQGHLALVETALAENEIVVCSIFVNPTQFDNKEDLNKYPRLEDNDIRLLEAVGCHVLFMPSPEVMYPNGFEVESFQFGNLQRVMEGASRPGHFDGVATIVHKLFVAVQPQRAYFGKKDYQQLQIIKALVAKLKLNIEIVACDTYRERDGLAMSSRNLRLTPGQRAIAPSIYQLLKEASILSAQYNAGRLKEWMKRQVELISEMELVYFEIADANDLTLALDEHSAKGQMGFIVVKMGEIRLIDNILL